MNIKLGLDLLYLQITKNSDYTVLFFISSKKFSSSFS